MRSIRTKISMYEKRAFQEFLYKQGLEGILVGDYEVPNWYTSSRNICYAYSDSDDNLTEKLNFLILKHGSLEEAFFNNISSVSWMA